MHANALTNLLLSVASGVLTAAVFAIWRWVRKTAKGLLRVVEMIESFGAEWHDAVALAQAIRDGHADIEALKLQLGTEGRDPAWASLEAYLHQMRHEARNESAKVGLVVQTLERVSAEVGQVFDKVQALVDAL